MLTTSSRIKQPKIRAVYEQFNGDLNQVRTFLDDKVAYHEEWYLRGAKRAGEKRTKVEKDLIGAKKTMKRVK